jgi:hypothetical protein
MKKVLTFLILLFFIVGCSTEKRTIPSSLQIVGAYEIVKVNPDGIDLAEFPAIFENNIVYLKQEKDWILYSYDLKSQKTTRYSIKNWDQIRIWGDYLVSDKDFENRLSNEIKAYNLKTKTTKTIDTGTVLDVNENKIYYTKGSGNEYVTQIYNLEDGTSNILKNQYLTSLNVNKNYILYLVTVDSTQKLFLEDMNTQDKIELAEFRSYYVPSTLTDKYAIWVTDSNLINYLDINSKKIYQLKTSVNNINRIFAYDDKIVFKDNMCIYIYDLITDKESKLLCDETGIASMDMYNNKLVYENNDFHKVTDGRLMKSIFLASLT